MKNGGTRMKRSSKLCILLIMTITLFPMNSFALGSNCLPYLRSKSCKNPETERKGSCKSCEAI